MNGINNLKKLETISNEAKLIDKELEILSLRLDKFTNNIEVVEEVSERMSRIFLLYKEFCDVLPKQD